MPPETYRQRIADSRHPQGVRQRLVQHYLEHRNLSLTARAFGCDRKTARFWVTRYRQGGWAALLDHRQPGHAPPHKTPSSIEREVIRLRRRNPRLGQDKIQAFLARRGIHRSTATINRILHAHGLVKRRIKRWQRRRLATEVRKVMRAFEKLQVDTKDLNDIPALLPAIHAKQLPGIEYTAKDVTTGLAFVCLAFERSEINSLRFIHLLFQHLTRHGVDLTQVTVQSDNGSEFIGSVEAKRASAFTRLIEQRYGARHLTIPVRAPRFNGVVENFHGRVEDEFYTIEPLPTEAEMLERLFGYILYYNFGRPNEGLGMKTPIEALQEKAPQISPDVGALSPIVLDRIELSVTDLLPPISGASGENRPDAHTGPATTCDTALACPLRRGVRAVAGKRSLLLLNLDLRALALEFGLDLCCFLLAHLLFDGLGGIVDKILCLLQSKPRKLADDFDDLDLLLPYGLEDHVKLRLLFRRLRWRGAGRNRRDSDGRGRAHPELLLQRLH